jgi:hypothetical protein
MADKNKIHSGRAFAAYCKEAHAQGFAPWDPDKAWLRDYVQEAAMLWSLDYAHLLLAAIKAFFATHDLSFPLAGEEDTLICTPLQHARDPDTKGVASLRYIPYSTKLERSRLRWYGCWEQYAMIHTIPPLSPSPQQFAAFIAYKADRHGWTSLSCMLVLFGQYFERTGASVNVAKSAPVKRIADAVRRSKPGLRYEVSLKDIGRVLDAIPLSPYGIRDRLMVLLSRIGGLTAVQMTKVKREELDISDEGVMLVCGDRSFFIARADDVRFDIVHWIRLWLALGDHDGPLFPSTRITRVGSPLDKGYISGRLGELVGPKHASACLRRSFIRQSTIQNGAVITAKYMHYKTLGAIARHYPELAVLGGHLRELSGSSRWSKQHRVRAE